MIGLSERLIGCYHKHVSLGLPFTATTLLDLSHTLSQLHARAIRVLPYWRQYQLLSRAQPSDG